MQNLKFLTQEIAEFLLQVQKRIMSRRRRRRKMSPTDYTVQTHTLQVVHFTGEVDDIGKQNGCHHYITPGLKSLITSDL